MIILSCTSVTSVKMTASGIVSCNHHLCNVSTLSMASICQQRHFVFTNGTCFSKLSLLLLLLPLLLFFLLLLLLFSLLWLCLLLMFGCTTTIRSKSQPSKVKIDTHVSNSTVNLQGYDIQKVCRLSFPLSSSAALSTLLFASLFLLTWDNPGNRLRDSCNCSAKYQDIYRNRGNMFRRWHGTLSISKFSVSLLPSFLSLSLSHLLSILHSSITVLTGRRVSRTCALTNLKKSNTDLF